MRTNLLTIIIPVRKEEENIRTTILSLQKKVQTPHCILIADDATDPADRTVTVVRQMKNRSVSISEKKPSDQDGFGPVLVRAVQKVKTPYTLFVMADMSDDPKSIDPMVQTAIQHACDIVCGCRYMQGAKKIGGPLLQGFFSTMLNTFLFSVLHFPTWDATNAFKLYKTTFLKSILPQKPSSGVEFSLQLMSQAVPKNPIVHDVPTEWRGRVQGQSKVKLFNRGPKYMKIVWDTLISSI